MSKNQGNDNINQERKPAGADTGPRGAGLFGEAGLKAAIAQRLQPAALSVLRQTEDRNHQQRNESGK